MTEPEHGERPRRERPPPAPVLYGTEPETEPTGPVRVTVTGYALAGPFLAERRALRMDHVPERLLAKDATLWGPEAESEAAIRLGWLDLPRSSRELLPRLMALHAELVAEGLDRVVLCGMGGSSLAPEVICRTADVPLVVLDSTDPHQVSAALVDLERTVVVVSSKSGSTVETDAQRRILADAFSGIGLDAATVGRRFVAVTDPGSALAKTAEAAGFRAVFLADPNVGGRYSALSAFGLVPSALAGADVTALLDDAAAVIPDLSSETGNPGLDLGAALGGAGAAGRDKVLLADAESGLAGFGDWAEQLLAESTGKDDRGLLPVVLDTAAPPGDDGHVVLLGEARPKSGTTVQGPLGGQFLVWEYATALAGRILRVNPFDQPDVELAKTNTRALLDAPTDLPIGEPLLVEGPVEVYADPSLLGGERDLASLLERLVAAVPPTGYVAVMAYLDRYGDGAAAALRGRLAAHTARPVTFGWGPRFLHSTGQYHKGGPATGVYLQITGATDIDVEIPGLPFTLGRLQLAQALGDGRALRDRGRPAVRLHLTDRPTGIAALLAAVPEPSA